MDHKMRDIEESPCAILEDFSTGRLTIDFEWILDSNVSRELLTKSAAEAGITEPDRKAYFVFRRNGAGIFFCAYSRYVESLIGFGSRAFLGMSVRELYGGRPGLSEVLENCLEHRVAQYWEGWYTFHSDNSTRYLNAWCTYAEPDFVVISGEDKSEHARRGKSVLKDNSYDSLLFADTAGKNPHASSIVAGPPGIFIFTARPYQPYSIEFINNRAAFILDSCRGRKAVFPDCVENSLRAEDRGEFRELVFRATLRFLPVFWESKMPAFSNLFLRIEAWPEAPAFPGMRYFGMISTCEIMKRPEMNAQREHPQQAYCKRVDEIVGLSHREREVARCLTNGMSNVEIARALFIQECTVKKHVTSLFIKSGVSNRVEFIINYADSV